MLFFSCPCKLSIRIKKVTKSTTKRDPLVCDFPGVVKIFNNHNHCLDSTESLHGLKLLQETKHLFFNYFSIGRTPAEAIRMNEENILETEGACGLANNRKNPNHSSVYYFWKQWKMQNECSSYIDESMSNKNFEQTSDNVTTTSKDAPPVILKRKTSKTKDNLPTVSMTEPSFKPTFTNIVAASECSEPAVSLKLNTDKYDMSTQPDFFMSEPNSEQTSTNVSNTSEDADPISLKENIVDFTKKNGDLLTDCFSVINAKLGNSFSSKDASQAIEKFHFRLHAIETPSQLMSLLQFTNSNSVPTNSAREQIPAVSSNTGNPIDKRSRPSSSPAPPKKRARVLVIRLKNNQYPK